MLLLLFFVVVSPGRNLKTNKGRFVEIVHKSKKSSVFIYLKIQSSVNVVGCALFIVTYPLQNLTFKTTY